MNIAIEEMRTTVEAFDAHTRDPSIEIEWKKIREPDGIWYTSDICKPVWNQNYIYRIAPHQPTPPRPYTNTELKELVGSCVDAKNFDARYFVVAYHQGVVRLWCGADFPAEYSSNELLETKLHLDGSPCGVSE